MVPKFEKQLRLQLPRPRQQQRSPLPLARRRLLVGQQWQLLLPRRQRLLRLLPRLPLVLQLPQLPLPLRPDLLLGAPLPPVVSPVVQLQHLSRRLPFGLWPGLFAMRRVAPRLVMRLVAQLQAYQTLRPHPQGL